MSDSRFSNLDWPEDIKGVAVQAAEFLVATADDVDHPADRAVGDLLRRVREGVGMDIVFISQFVDGQRLIREVVATEEGEGEFHRGDSDPLEETYCQQIVDGRLPQMGGEVPPPAPGATGDARRRVGAYVTVPIMCGGGKVYGTLCCISRAQRPQLGARSELQAVTSVAHLLSSVLSRG
jgi:GAF domain-containing protein